MSSPRSEARRRDAPAGREGEEPVLSVQNLQTVFRTDRETIRAVDGIDIDLYEGETVGLVGESGSGKSVTARSIMGLIEDPGEVLAGSSIEFKGEEITGYNTTEYQNMRGSGIGMVFQDPLSSLNPVFTVGNQIREALKVNRGITGEAAREEALGRCLLDDLTRVHHVHAVGDVGDDPHVVRDEEDRQPSFRLQFFEEFEDLRLDRHVERRRRLVADQHFRLAGQHHRDDRPLPHSTGELVRVLP